MKQFNNDDKIKIEIFSSPGCSKCKRAKDVLHKIVDEMNAGYFQWKEINILEELDYAVKLGVFSTPAIVIDGKLVFPYLPSAKKLKKFLKNILSSANGVNYD